MGIMVCYAETVIGNHDVNAVPVSVNHGELCTASGLWIMMCYAVPVLVNHGELWSASGCELWRVILIQWVRIMLCYAEPVVWRVMLCQWL